MMMDSCERFGFSQLDQVVPTAEGLLLGSVEQSDLGKAKFYLNSGANVNYVDTTNKTPLSTAVVNKDMDMIHLLLEHGADASRESYCSDLRQNETPLVTAARLQCIDMVEAFLNKTNTLMFSNHRSSHVRSAVHWAAAHGDIRMARLLKSKGADLNWSGPDGHTALHYATLADRPKMVMWLLDNGAKKSAVNTDGRTALHLAAIKGLEAILQDLVDAGSEVDMKDSFGHTPLGLASLRGELKNLRYLVEYSQAGRMIDLDDCLHQAAQGRSLDTIDYLLNKGAKINSTNILGETALAIAARCQAMTVLLLLSRGAQINVLDHRGYTPLQLSLLGSAMVEVATLLVRHGAYLHPMNLSTESPLHLAYKIGDPLLLLFILKAGCCLGKEKWFNEQLVTEKIKELDYQGVRRPRYLKNSSGNPTKDMWLAIIEQLHEPRSLTDACRITIREFLVLVHNSQSMLQYIDSLPLPVPLKRFLRLEDVIPRHNQKQAYNNPLLTMALPPADCFLY